MTVAMPPDIAEQIMRNVQGSSLRDHVLKELRKRGWRDDIAIVHWHEGDRQ